MIRLIGKVSCICEILSCVRLHIQILWKFQVTIYFYSSHLVIIKLESFNCYCENIGKRFYAESFLSSYLFLAWFTKICIVSIKNLSLNKALKSFFKCFLSPYVDPYWHKMLLLFGFMRTAFTIQLIAQHSFKSIFYNIMSLITFQETLNFFHELIVKLISIWLHTGING